MATSKKASKKSTKKASTKKAATTARMKLSFPIDAEKVEAIKRCLAKGTLTVTVNKAELASGRFRNAYIYD